MAWTTPRTWTSTVLSAAALNTDVRDNLNYLHDSHAVRVRKSAAQSIPNDTVTAITFDLENFDLPNNDMHSVVSNTNRLNITEAGKYIIGASAQFDGNATGYRQLSLRVNGTTQIGQSTTAAVNSATIQTSVEVTAFYDFQSGDYIEVLARQNSGGALNVNSTADSSPVFWAQWVRG